MKTERNIFIAFILNFAFAIFEFIGGMITGSVAIASDAVHDIGDAASIGISYFLEKKSKQKPNETYTYGYVRYSVLGGLLTTVILLVGSLVMIYHSVKRLINPVDVHYDGMILFAIVGVCVNFFAAWFTHEGDSLNQKAVNLHMLEDVFGWAIVLVGATVMRFTDLTILDPILSVGVSVFILINAIRNLKEITELFLEKAPHDVDMEEVKEHISTIEGVVDIHHIHVWSMDGHNHYATMHVVTDCEPHHIKDKIREELREHGIGHVTLEIESSDEHCHEKECSVECHSCAGHHHGHHHNH